MDIEKRDQHLDDILGISNQEIEVYEDKIYKGELIQENNDDQECDLLDDSNKKLDHLYDQTQSLIEGISTNALEFQKDRSYEVASTLIKAAVEIQRQKKDNYLAKKQIINNKSNGENEQNIQQQNNIFVGDSRELLELLKNKS